MTSNKSLYDPSRDTVGKIYRDNKMNYDGTPIDVGDMTRELTTSLVEDINQTIIDGNKEFKGNEFYITVHEKKDLAMPNCILRRMVKTAFRPYPEDDSMVFRVIPKEMRVLFCWCLPHWSEMTNILNNVLLYEPEMVQQLQAWKREDLYHFGFRKDPMGNWEPNPHFEDKKMENKKAFNILTA